MTVKEKKRKVRSDKKRDVKPTIPVNLKECIYRLSYITNMPVKDIVESICDSGIRSRKVIDHLSQHFKRNLKFSNTLYIGDISRTPLHRLALPGKKERITTRLKDGDEETYDKIKQLAYALDCTPTTATALLLEVSIKNTDYVNEQIKSHLQGQLEPGRIKELKAVLNYINKNNPYDEEISLSAIIFYLLDELKIGATNINHSIQAWLDKVK